MFFLQGDIGKIYFCFGLCKYCIVLECMYWCQKKKKTQAHYHRSSRCRFKIMLHVNAVYSIYNVLSVDINQMT